MSNYFSGWRLSPQGECRFIAGPNAPTPKDLADGAAALGLSRVVRLQLFPSEEISAGLRDETDDGPARLELDRALAHVSFGATDAEGVFHASKFYLWEVSGTYRGPDSMLYNMDNGAWVLSQPTPPNPS